MDEIETPQMLLEFMKKNFKYGWIGIDKSIHIESLNNFRNLYRISSLEEIISSKLVTCIETAIFAKEWFDSKGIKNNIFCFRSYEDKNLQDEKVRMHIIIIYFENGKYYHFEYSNRLKQGIYEYSDIDTALEEITKGLEESESRILTEIDSIPTGISFYEFNNFVNNSKKESEIIRGKRE